MSAARDKITGPQLADLDEAAIVGLCNSLADYGEAGGLSRELMLQVGQYSEIRFAESTDVLLAVARMYLLGGESVRAKGALLRAGQIGNDEMRVRPLLSQVLRVMGDTRSVDQALQEAQPRVASPATPQPLSPRSARPQKSSSPPGGQPIAGKVTPIGRRAAQAVASPPKGPPVKPEDIRTEVSRRVAPKDLADTAEAFEPAAAQDVEAPKAAKEAAEPTAPSPVPRIGGGGPRASRIKLLDPEDDRRRLDPYELIGEIASGGMATVFLARLAGAYGFQRFVAIKRLHPHLVGEEQFVQMFHDEARLAAGIHHPHVVPILEVVMNESGYYLVMEFIEGDTLSGLTIRSLQRGEILPPPVALRIVLDSLAGLHAAHELTDADGRHLGLVHRDCTPQNMLVGIDGSARITDFGVARAASRLAITRPQTVKGKVAYLSPEQAHAHEVDRRSDLFTMGIVLWEALAGRPLFTADTETATLSRLLSASIPAVRSFAPDTPRALEDVVRRALQRDRNRRFRTAAEMGEALEQAARSQGSAGVASPRDLGRFVEGLMGPEIAAQRDVVRSWLGQNEISPLSRASRVAGPMSMRAPIVLTRLPPSEAAQDRSTTGGGAAVADARAPEEAAGHGAEAQAGMDVATAGEAFARTQATRAAAAPATETPVVPEAPLPPLPSAGELVHALAARGTALVLPRVQRVASRRISLRAGIALVVAIVLVATLPLWLRKAANLRASTKPAASASARPKGRKLDHPWDELPASATSEPEPEQAPWPVHE